MMVLTVPRGLMHLLLLISVVDKLHLRKLIPLSTLAHNAF